MKDLILRLINNIFPTIKKCPHGATSWYICPECKRQFPKWSPFEGEGPYNPYIKL